MPEGTSGQYHLPADHTPVSVFRKTVAREVTLNPPVFPCVCCVYLFMPSVKSKKSVSKGAGASPGTNLQCSRSPAERS
jgi:hypothetical protein